MAANPPTLLWHDYETWGANPIKDGPAQFAAIRTDYELNVVEKPLNWYCQIASDVIPHPEACLVTGITPQQSLRDGLNEAEFAQRIYEAMSQPNTTVVGYNNVRFDDEVTRHMLFRNFYDPYEREWQNGNSRWDIIDVVRACYALRPEGINWVYRDDGSPSFRLEDLTNANNIEHGSAHDATSDVHATIALAKLIKTQQPKLYHYLFDLRIKRRVRELIDLQNLTPLVHVSSKLPAINGCATWIVPIASHPKNQNAVICLNLALDPTPLFELDADTLRERLYRRNDDLGDDEQRLPIKLVHINKCPVLAPAKTLTEDNAERLGIDREQCLSHLALLKKHSGFHQRVLDIFDTEGPDTKPDPQHSLYHGGFLSDGDRQRCQTVINAAPEQLSALDWHFEDPRLQTLLFRYRARNFPQTLTHDEQTRWQQHRQYWLTSTDSPASLTMDELAVKLDSLCQQYENDADKLAILRAVYQYASEL